MDKERELEAREALGPEEAVSGQKPLRSKTQRWHTRVSIYRLKNRAVASSVQKEGRICLLSVAHIMGEGEATGCLFNCSQALARARHALHQDTCLSGLFANVSQSQEK